MTPANLLLMLAVALSMAALVRYVWVDLVGSLWIDAEVIAPEGDGAQIIEMMFRRDTLRLVDHREAVGLAA